LLCGSGAWPVVETVEEAPLGLKRNICHGNGVDPLCCNIYPSFTHPVLGFERMSVDRVSELCGGTWPRLRGCHQVGEVVVEVRGARSWPRGGVLELRVMCAHCPVAHFGTRVFYYLSSQGRGYLDFNKSAVASGQIIAVSLASIYIVHTPTA
jgi:hypothetical protein